MGPAWHGQDHGQDRGCNLPRARRPHFWDGAGLLLMRMCTHSWVVDDVTPLTPTWAPLARIPEC